LKKKRKIKRIGILGGTFDPPHIGHLHITKIALKKIKLAKVFWVITKQNPFKKKPHLNKKIRIELSRGITRNEKKISIMHLDKKIKSKNTYDLLHYLKKRKIKDELFFLMGADNLINLHKWRKWKKIPELAKIVVFAKPNYSIKALNSVAAKKLQKKDWLYINHKKLNISSSLIRKF